MCLIKEGKDTISSYELADLCNLNPAIIRKDFSYFGDFGKRGVGYNVSNLMNTIRNILGLIPLKRVALIGVGNIGNALLLYPNFELEGFKIVLAFDNQSTKIGRKINGVTIEDVSYLEKRLKSHKIHLCILAVPESAAPVIAHRLAKTGVKAILSFSPCQLAMPDNIKVTCVDLSTEMARLVYYSSREIFSEIRSLQGKTERHKKVSI